MDRDAFVPGSPSHLFVIVLTASLAFWMVRLARRAERDSLPRGIAYFWGGLLILNYLLYVLYRIFEGYWEIRYDLPMEFCNWAAAVTVLALFTRNRLMAELSYFWVTAGSILALMTPDLKVSFPHLYFFIFFIGHSGLVISSMYAVFGLRLYPRRGSVLRVFLISQLYLAAAFGVNLAVRGNYGYLMNKPAASTLFDLFGGWPLYLAEIQWVGLFLFILVYLPFYFMNRKSLC